MPEPHALLREIAGVRQDDAGLTRRWFHSDYFDLFLWQDAVGAVVHFQLCYDIGARERALVWKQGLGFFHDGVDTGEALPGQNRSPLFVADGAFAAHPVAKRFERESGELPERIARFVRDKLAEFAPSALRSRPCRRQTRRADWQHRSE